MKKKLFTRRFIQRSFSEVGSFSIAGFVLQLVVLQHCVHAQAGEWTWMKGENSFNSQGTFGTLGVPDVANTPPALYGPISWTDLTGKFWLYGGATAASNVHNALWSFDPDLNIWTWVNGLSTPNQIASYGTIGVPSPSNTPGCRAYGAAAWTDLNGNLWFYGGASAIGPAVSDLWKYDIATNEWTCMGLYSFDANHGIKGVAAASNSPGARDEFNSAWMSDAGDLWFYGGQGGVFMFADVWEYQISTGNMIWMEGDSMSGIILPTYGSPGIFNSTNNPGSRIAYCHWKDANDKFWIYGGGNPYVNLYSDLWQFDPVLNEWAWMGGDTSSFYAGNFITKCDTENNNQPRCATENRACWIDHDGRMWKMGGAINSSYDLTNDLWVYNPNAQNWTWVSGSSIINQNPVYGTQGISDPANVPGASLGSVGWTDQQCSLWFFGGITQVNSPQASNAMWRYVPDSLCGGGSCNIINQSQNISASNTKLCEKYCIDFYDSSLNNPTAWQWIFIGGNPSSSTDQNPTTICYNLPGTYDVTLITTNANGNDTLTLLNYITVYPTPPFPTITQVGYLLTSSPASSYQWQLNSVDIPGATNQSYSILQSGLYTVIVGDSNSCKNSFTQYVLISGIGDAESDANISIYPNPSSGSFTVELLNEEALGEVSIDIMNTFGQKVFSYQQSRSTGITNDWSAGLHSKKKEIDLSALTCGVYFIEIKTKNVFLRTKILITN
jgi:PKD repeat protein